MLPHTRIQVTKYLAVTIVLMFLVCTGVYLSFNTKALVPSLSDGEIPQDSPDIPLTDDDIYVDDTVAKKLFNEVKIFCWILTTKTGVVTKAAAVNFTWAPRCNKHIYFASLYGKETLPNGDPKREEPQQNTVDLSAGQSKNYTTATGKNFTTITVGDVIYIDTPEGWQNLTEKSREILQLIYLTELEPYDWFLKADDDTYVILENLRYLLRKLDSKKPAYLGYHLEPVWFDSPYMSGGAGYVFSKVGLKRLVEKGLQVKGVCRDKGSFEDLEVGRCATKAGVAIYSSLDKFERETFHPDNLKDFIPGPPQQWLFSYSRNKPKGGSECCSQFSVSFHRMSLQEMLIFDHLLYRTNVYGRHLIGKIPNFFKQRIVKKLPNGIPTINQ